MNLLALDVATVVGCCDGKPGERPRLWTWDLRDAGDTRPLRFLALHRLLHTYFAEWACDGVVYEAPMPVGAMYSAGAHAATVLMTHGAIGVVELACASHDKPVEGFPVGRMRGAVLGWGRNEVRHSGIETKERVMKGVRLLGADPEDDNQADAFVVWAFACARLNPRTAHLTTPLFSRGEEKVV